MNIFRLRLVSETGLSIAEGQSVIVNFIDFAAISYYHYTGCYSVFSAPVILIGAE